MRYVDGLGPSADAPMWLGGGDGWHMDIIQSMTQRRIWLSIINHQSSITHVRTHAHTYARTHTHARTQVSRRNSPGPAARARTARQAQLLIWFSAKHQPPLQRHCSPPPPRPPPRPPLRP